MPPIRAASSVASAPAGRDCAARRCVARRGDARRCLRLIATARASRRASRRRPRVPIGGQPSRQLAPGRRARGVDAAARATRPSFALHRPFAAKREIAAVVGERAGHRVAVGDQRRPHFAEIQRPSAAEPSMRAPRQTRRASPRFDAWRQIEVVGAALDFARRPMRRRHPSAAAITAAGSVTSASCSVMHSPRSAIVAARRSRRRYPSAPARALALQQAARDRRPTRSEFARVAAAMSPRPRQSVPSAPASRTASSGGARDARVEKRRGREPCGCDDRRERDRRDQDKPRAVAEPSSGAVSGRA